ncbi:MAG: carboxypeptidase-like regulatory domain-containing protein, partial [Candidatus Micrarchaeota archaeon]|nr:carboxypeptidase-like regulatory domain-containing protein [Candidatus Micrarchaeota archaeon]
MKFKFTFAILMLFALSFPYWQESINVTVYSKDGIPMRNAEVMLIYQTYACDKRANITKYTNESGMVSFSFLNTVDESFGKCVERFYTIRANYGGYSNSTVGYVDNKDKNYKLWLPFIAHFISVRDALNRPIGNATITAMNQTYQTDAAGNAYILLPIGTSTEVRVGYGDASASLSINPTASSSTNVTLRVFDLRVSLT